jgi:hypothetical protein
MPSLRFNVRTCLGSARSIRLRTGGCFVRSIFDSLAPS